MWSLLSRVNRLQNLWQESYQWLELRLSNIHPPVFSKSPNMFAIRLDRADGTRTALLLSLIREPEARGLSSSPDADTSGVGMFLPMPTIGPSCLPSEKLTDRR